MGGRGLAVGGGGGIVVVLLVLIVNALGGGGGGGTDPFALGTGTEAQGDNTDLAASCQTGSDANQQDDCRIVAVVNSVQDYWDGAVRQLLRREPEVLT